MKKLKFLVLALIVAAPIMVNAADPTDVGTLSALKECVDVTGSICKLTADITDVNETILIDGGVNVTIDLNGHDIIGILVADMFEISNGSLVVKNSSSTEGTIWDDGDGYGGAFYVKGNTTYGGSAIPAKLTIGTNVSVVSDTSNCIFIKGNGAEATINGSLESKGVYATIQGNGTVDSESNKDNGHTVMTINSGAVVKAVTHAIYHPQSGTLTVNGGTITGNTGIEMRSGDLIVNGGTITSTATTTTVTNNGDGSAVDGAGIAIAQHNTLQAASITVNGGTISGPTALLEATPENPHDATVVSLSITGGEFISTVEDGDAISSENKTEFITGGSFNGTIDSGYVSTEGDLIFKNDDEGNLIILDYTKVNALIEKIKKLGLDKYQTEEDLKKDYTEKSVDALMAVGEKLEDITTQEELDKWVEELENAIDGLKLIKDETPNPDTGDNIVTYVLAATASILLVSASLILKKRYN